MISNQATKLIQRKAPARRAFSGLAGSPLAQITATTPATPVAPNATALPTTRLTSAEKARQRRAIRALARDAAKNSVKETFAVKDNEAACDREVQAIFKNEAGLTPIEIAALVSEVLDKYGIVDPPAEHKIPHMNDGMYMRDAPRGKGLLICGGYGPEKCARVIDASDAVELIGGKRVKPQGRSSKEDEDGGRVVGSKGGAKYIEEHTPKFTVRLNEGYVLDAKQIKFERLAKQNASEFAREEREEAKRLNAEFLTRVEQGPLTRDGSSH
jgi:hypothetical protein